MANSRLLTRVTLTTADDDIKATHSVDGAATFSISTSTSYYLSTDNAADDLYKAIETAIVAAFASISTCTIAIYGVDATSASRADGRIKVTIDSGDLTFNFTDVAFTMSARIFGFDGTADESTTSSTLDSDFVHRYGWYPQRDPIDDEPGDVTSDNSVSRATDRTISVVTTGGADYDSGTLQFEQVPAALVRTKSATNSTRVGNVNTTINDPNCSFEAWVADSKTNPWRFYKVATAATTSDFDGPYQLRPETGIYQRATATVRDIDGSDSSFVEVPFEAVPA